MKATDYKMLVFFLPNLNVLVMFGTHMLYYILENLKKSREVPVDLCFHD